MRTVKKEMGEILISFFFSSTEYNAQEATERMIKRSPGLNDIPDNTSHDPLAMMTSIPQIDTAMAKDSMRLGFSRFIIQEKNNVITGMAATTSEILVAVVYWAPRYKTELYAATLGMDKIDKKPRFFLIFFQSFFKCEMAKGIITANAVSHR